MSDEAKVRGLNPADFEQLDAWLRSEAEHAHVTHKEFEGVGRRTLVIEDEQGVVIYARLTKVWRVDLQFNNTAHKSRIVKALKQLMENGSNLAKINGFREIVCETKSERLKYFMQRLGFRPDPATLRKDIEGVDNVFRQQQG